MLRCLCGISGGVSPKIPAGLHVFHKGAQYFLIVLRHFYKKPFFYGQKMFLNAVHVNVDVHLCAVQELQFIRKH